MTIGESEPYPTLDHLLDWLGDSVSFLPSLPDDPYSGDINGYDWWNRDISDHHDGLIDVSTTPAATAGPTLSSISDHQPPYKKRKSPDDPEVGRGSPGRPINDTENASIEELAGTAPTKTKRPVKKSRAKGPGSNCNNANNKDGRWAEQLLLPCAAAAAAGDLSRVQHLLYVVKELASATGDANHRLSYYGLRALTHQLSSGTAVAAWSFTFALSGPRFFQKSLLKFNELSPWFAFPNNIANASILQILAEEANPAARNLHILDIGVSHGVQWPTLLEALTRLSGGPPPLVRLTIISAAADTDQKAETPFSVGPSGDNFSSRLLGFAKTLKINLEIKLIENHPLQILNPQIINSSIDETLIVNTQFRLHHLNHSSPDERTEFLKSLTELGPRAVVLSENNTDSSRHVGGDFAAGFSRRVEFMWRFLESTSSAFKGRESEERRLMEGEAAKGMTNRGEMNEGEERWGERMRGAGFAGVGFGENAIDGARALLRKYDGNWEMRMEEKDECSISLWWKGQPVSFSSLWKLSDVKNDR